MQPFDERIPEEEKQENKALIAFLRQAYRSPAAVTTDEGEQVLARIRERLLRYDETEMPGIQTFPLSLVDEESPLLPVRLLRPHAIHGRKLAFLAVAAVVMITVLSIILLNVKSTIRFQQNQPTLFVGTDAQLLQELVQDKGTPPNIEQLLQSGQFTSVNLASRTDDVHIQKVYADANNVVLLYTVDQSAWNAATSSALPPATPDSEPVLMLETSTGQVLPEMAERANFGKGPLAGENKLVAVLAYYDASAVQGDPTQLTLTAALSKKISPSQEKIGEITMPAHTEKKVLNVHQTASSNRHTLTLGRVVITPTEARFYYSYPPLVRPTTDSVVGFGNETLSVAGKTYEPNPFPDDNSGDVYGWFDPGAPHRDYTSFHETLLDQTGTWVYTEQAFTYQDITSSAPPIHYVWKITFTVSY